MNFMHTVFWFFFATNYTNYHGLDGVGTRGFYNALYLD